MTPPPLPSTPSPLPSVPVAYSRASFHPAQQALSLLSQESPIRAAALRSLSKTRDALAARLSSTALSAETHALTVEALDAALRAPLHFAKIAALPLPHEEARGGSTGARSETGDAAASCAGNGLEDVLEKVAEAEARVRLLAKVKGLVLKVKGAEQALDAGEHKAAADRLREAENLAQEDILATMPVLDGVRENVAKRINTLREMMEVDLVRAVLFGRVEQKTGRPPDDRSDCARTVACEAAHVLLRLSGPGSAGRVIEEAVGSAVDSILKEALSCGTKASVAGIDGPKSRRVAGHAASGVGASSLEVLGQKGSAQGRNVAGAIALEVAKCVCALFDRIVRLGVDSPDNCVGQDAWTSVWNDVDEKIAYLAETMLGSGHSGSSAGSTALSVDPAGDTSEKEVAHERGGLVIQLVSNLKDRDDRLASAIDCDTESKATPRRWIKTGFLSLPDSVPDIYNLASIREPLARLVSHGSDAMVSLKVSGRNGRVRDEEISKEGNVGKDRDGDEVSPVDEEEQSGNNEGRRLATALHKAGEQLIETVERDVARVATPTLELRPSSLLNAPLTNSESHDLSLSDSTTSPSTPGSSLPSSTLHLESVRGVAVEMSRLLSTQVSPLAAVKILSPLLIDISALGSLMPSLATRLSLISSRLIISPISEHMTAALDIVATSWTDAGRVYDRLFSIHPTLTPTSFLTQPLSSSARITADAVAGLYHNVGALPSALLTPTQYAVFARLIASCPSLRGLHASIPARGLALLHLDVAVRCFVTARVCWDKADLPLEVPSGESGLQRGEIEYDEYGDPIDGDFDALSDSESSDGVAGFSSAPALGENPGLGEVEDETTSSLAEWLAAVQCLVEALVGREEARFVTCSAARSSALGIGVPESVTAYLLSPRDRKN